MIDYRGIVRKRLLERTEELRNLTEAQVTSRADHLSGEVKALTDLLLDFGEADCDLGHQILEAQRNRQDVLDAMIEAQAARGPDPEDA